ncbi:hypothetical protein M427DRAFT_33955 [Gonapodya prolifera JEL478]|uniref:Uncharacterized protein n=1 Tax=Gonapodya prolifera (strain JEL478) TaxID=1344416 RepID=A0A139AA31_GONPJ|nr:hypothetical protein M427DRAFT_33955 [Gonapodya prolifera JEL478]|eukprot:KXS13355.1 hypothetical protein M427DRAFT_33955 [Gonapodya prolifera JEL478]
MSLFTSSRTSKVSDNKAKPLVTVTGFAIDRSVGNWTKGGKYYHIKDSTGNETVFTFKVEAEPLECAKFVAAEMGKRGVKISSELVDAMVAKDNDKDAVALH